MEEVTIGELSRLLKIHMDESNKKHDRTYEKLEDQDHILQATLIQAQKTNGRVLSLEKSREENEKKFELVDTINTERWIARGVIALVLIAGGSYMTLALNGAKADLKQELTQNFERLLDERVSGVYLDK